LIPKLFSHKIITKITLRQLILILAIASAAASLANTVYASYQVLRQQLIENTLESNHAYSSKMAASIDDFMDSVQQQLKVSAETLSGKFDDPAFLDAETHRLLSQTDSFNSVVVLNHSAKVLATSPESLSVKGRTLDTLGATESIRTKQPLITKPYISAAGNLVVVISHPVFEKDGTYSGAIAGTLYLKKESIFSHLMTSHYYADGSYLYVVDRDRRLIHHPTKERVGTIVGPNKAIDDIIDNNHSGKMETTNSFGTEVLAGYAIIPATGWGVVTQRSRADTLASLDRLVIDVLKHALPIAIISLLIIWWCTKLISRPLHQLADGARKMSMRGTDKEINKVDSWYYESSELKKAILVGIRLLQKNINKLVEATQTDPLTQLGNRRTLELALDTWKTSSTPFSVISADIDYFKKINDTYGHDTGDIVLKKLADMMKEVSRANDVVCRVGGEEFLILLPNTNSTNAVQIAERLRSEVEKTDIPPIGHITISLGVAQWTPESGDVAQTLKVADELLYQAKHNGRNRVESVLQTSIPA
jgi:diguanylate cyclase (GGDEF)-like protein